jgi:hypothetical protein
LGGAVVILMGSREASSRTYREGGTMIVKGEALIRLEAERRLLGAFRAEYDRLLKRTDHVHAVRSLVKAHKRAYDVALIEARAWAMPHRVVTASIQAA